MLKYSRVTESPISKLLSKDPGGKKVLTLFLQLYCKSELSSKEKDLGRKTIAKNSDL